MSDDEAREVADADAVTDQRALIGAVVSAPGLAREILSGVSAELFSDPRCRAVFSTLSRLHSTGAPLDEINAIVCAIRDDHADLFNPLSALKFLTDSISCIGWSGNWCWYAARLRGDSARQRLVRETSFVCECLERGSGLDGEAFTVEDGAERLRAVLDETAPDQQRGRFMCLSEFEAAEDEFPPVENLWDDLTLASGTIALLAGRTGHGKSFLAVQLAVCLTGGVAFLGRKTAQCPVLYLQSEIADSALLARFRGVLPKLCEGMTPDQLDGIRRNLIVRTETAEFCLYRSPDRFPHNGKRPTASSPEACVAAVENEIARRGIRLAILDPWSDLVRIEENSGAEVTAALSPLKRLSQRFGVAWLLIHHVPKSSYQSGAALDTASPRGHSKLADSASTVLTLSPAPTPNAATHCVFAATKTRYRPEPEPMIVRRPVPGALFFDLDTTLRAAGRPTPGEQEVVDTLTAATKPLFRAELRDALAGAYDIDPRTARRWIAGAQDSHRIRYDTATQKYSVRQEGKP